MAYQIYDITAFPVDDFPYYYCDANVWITTLKYYGIGGVETYEAPYQTFIDAIVNLNTTQDSEASKRIKNRPKIILSSLVLSEIINSFMRNVAMKAFFGGGDTYKNFDFKSQYRDDPNSDYKKQLKHLCTDISSFSDYTEIQNDDFIAIDPYKWITQLHLVDADFNDYFYYQYLKGKNIPFVTHDKDFKFQDIPIITANKRLLKIK